MCCTIHYTEVANKVRAIEATEEQAMVALPENTARMSQSYFREQVILYAIREAEKGIWHGIEMCRALMSIANRL